MSAKKMKKRAPGLLHAIYQLEDGNWLVHLREDEHIHTFGRSIDAAERNLRDAAALWYEVDPQDLAFRHEYHGLPPDTFGVVQELAAAREAASRAQELTRAAARRLMAIDGVSLRDAARILQVSHQRVQQVLNEG